MSDIDFPTEIEASGVIGRVDENWRAKFDALKSGYKEPVDNMTDEQLLQRGLVRMPVDADGEPIHAGDVLDGYGKTIEVVELRYGRSGWVLISRDGSGYADTFAFTHHHEPTVEDVLREFTDEVWNRCCEGATASDSGIDELVAECAAKLQLRENK